MIHSESSLSESVGMVRSFQNNNPTKLGIDRDNRKSIILGTGIEFFVTALRIENKNSVIPQTCLPTR